MSDEKPIYEKQELPPEMKEQEIPETMLDLDKMTTEEKLNFIISTQADTMRLLIFIVQAIQMMGVPIEKKSKAGIVLPFNIK